MIKPKPPCYGQTGEELEAFLRSRASGDAVAIRTTYGGLLQYELAEVTGGKRGRLYLDRACWNGGSAWYAKSGKNCRAPKGQAQLVIPTTEVLRWATEKRAKMIVLDVAAKFTLV